MPGDGLRMAPRLGIGGHNSVHQVVRMDAFEPGDAMLLREWLPYFLYKSLLGSARKHRESRDQPLEDEELAVGHRGQGAYGRQERVFERDWRRRIVIGVERADSKDRGAASLVNHHGSCREIA